MKIIITMAGRSSRFYNAGYSKPKFMLNIVEKTMFEWAVLSLKHFFQFDFIFICLKEHNASNFISEKCGSLGIKKYSLIELNEVTDGQATTLLTAKRYLSPDDEILIYNIDTYVKKCVIHPNQIKGDGWIPVFDAPGDHWSFVKCNQEFEISVVAEKKRISNLGTIGLYYFRFFKDYEEVYKLLFQDSSNEKYIAPMYNYLISKKKKIYAYIIDVNDIYPLGTPSEMKISEKRLTR